MFFWLYELPTAGMVALVAGFFVVATWLGILFVRPVLRLVVRRDPAANDLIGAILASHGVYYGILLGLLAVATYQNYSDAGTTVSNEAAALAALYRDVSFYPVPVRDTLQGSLREYTRFVIEEAWPQQRRGIIPTGGTARITVFQEALSAFEPATPGQELLHGEALRQFNHLIELRRLRLHSVTSGIPIVMWYVVGLGAVINIILVLLLDTRLAAQFFLGGMLSFFIGTVISMVAAMDYPFRGEVSISPAAFEIVYRDLMQPGGAGGLGAQEMP